MKKGIVIIFILIKMEERFQEIKKELGLTDAKMAEIFGFKTPNAYSNSSAKKRYENAVVRLYELIK